MTIRVIIETINILKKSIAKSGFLPGSVVASVVEGGIGLWVVGSFDAGFKVVSGSLYYARKYSYIQKYYSDKSLNLNILSKSIPVDGVVIGTVLLVAFVFPCVVVVLPLNVIHR